MYKFVVLFVVASLLSGCESQPRESQPQESKEIVRRLLPASLSSTRERNPIRDIDGFILYVPDDDPITVLQRALPDGVQTVVIIAFDANAKRLLPCPRFTISYTREEQDGIYERLARTDDEGVSRLEMKPTNSLVSIVLPRNWKELESPPTDYKSPRTEKDTIEVFVQQDEWLVRPSK